MRETQNKILINAQRSWGNIHSNLCVTNRCIIRITSLFKNSSLFYYGIYILLRGGFSFKIVISTVAASEGSFHMQVILYLILVNNRSQILTRCGLYKELMPVTVRIK